MFGLILIGVFVFIVGLFMLFKFEDRAGLAVVALGAAFFGLAVASKMFNDIHILDMEAKINKGYTIYANGAEIGDISDVDLDRYTVTIDDEEEKVLLTLK